MRSAQGIWSGDEMVAKPGQRLRADFVRSGIMQIPLQKQTDKARIESDIKQFHDNVLEVKVTDETRDVIELARRYCEDTKYFLGKKDYVTAFGCINYAHGLIDAIRKKWRE